MKYTAWLRTSSHKLHIETGCYNGTPKILRTCPTCCLEEKETLELLAVLPMCELNPVIEDENHFLKDCQLYNDIRQRSSEVLQNTIKQYIGCIFSSENIVESMTIIKKMFSKRFPQIEIKKRSRNEKTTER